MRPKLKENPREWQKFTLSTMAAVSLVGYLLYRRAVVSLPTLAMFIYFGGLVLIVCAVWPRCFRGFYRAGMTAGFYLGQVVGRILLTLVFFLCVTPLGFFLRLTGKDLLNLKRDPQAKSYWQPAKPNPHFDRLF